MINSMPWWRRSAPFRAFQPADRSPWAIAHERHSSDVLRSLLGRHLSRSVYSDVCADDRIPEWGGVLSTRDPDHEHDYYEVDWTVGLEFDGVAWCCFDWGSEANVSDHLVVTPEPPAIDQGCCVLADRFLPWSALVGRRLSMIEAFRAHETVLQEVVLHVDGAEPIFVGCRYPPERTVAAVGADCVLVVSGLDAMEAYQLGRWSKGLARTVIGQ